MARIACLVVPRFAVAALRRAEPELRGCPVVVCDAGGESRASGGVRPHARILEVSAEAARRGVVAGATVVQALALCTDLIVRPLDEETLAGARTALIEVGMTISPRVELEGGAGDRAGVIHLDVAGLDRLLGSGEGILAALLQRTGRIGLEAGAAIADRKATARIAAGFAARRGEALLVPAGRDAAWLAPRSIAALAPVAERLYAERRGRTHGSGWRSWPELSGELARLGIARLGDFAALPLAEVASRFGPPAAHLWRVAAGRDDSTLAPAPSPVELVEGTSLEYGVSSLEALLFVVRGLIDRVVARLQLSSLACRGFRLTLTLDDGARVEREVGVLAPTCDVKSLTLLARAALEADPPHAAIEGVRLTAVPDRLRPDQLDLFRPPGPVPARLSTALARLAALCGQSRVGCPVEPAGHRPDALALSPFTGELPAARARREAATIGEAGAPSNGGRAGAEEPPQIALRALRPPRPAEVFLEGGRIAYVRASGLGGRAITAAGPWRIDAEWWSESAARRDYYEVQLSDGGLYRLFRDAADWYVDGYYD